MNRKVAWFSSGAASAVMAKIVLDEYPDAIVVQCDLGDSEDEDNRRFTADCEAWFGRPVHHIRSEKFSNVDEVFEKRRYHAGINGAPCTSEMKVAPRLDFQLPSDENFWGYTCDKNDVRRFTRMVDTYPLMKSRAPLIERGLSKSDCFRLLEDSGINIPRVYHLGFPNANCIGCVKATSPYYWDMVRREFPQVFARRLEQSKKYGSKLTRLPGMGDKRFSLSDLPENIPRRRVRGHRCDFLCGGDDGK